MRLRPLPAGYGASIAARAAPLRIEERIEAKPLGTFSLAGAQMKLSGYRWPYAVCDRCGRESRGKLASASEAGDP